MTANSLTEKALQRFNTAFYLREGWKRYPSPEHEIVKGNLGYLIEDYMLNRGLEFVATGSFSQEKEAIASVQADESYCFDTKKPIPDLAIEVVITSGGSNKLRRYEALGVQEV